MLQCKVLGLFSSWIQILGNFRFATATKSSTTTRFFSSIFLQSETFFHLFIYKHTFLTMVESKHA